MTQLNPVGTKEDVKIEQQSPKIDIIPDFDPGQSPTKKNSFLSIGFNSIGAFLQVLMLTATLFTPFLAWTAWEFHGTTMYIVEAMSGAFSRPIPRPHGLRSKDAGEVSSSRTVTGAE